MTVMQPVSRNVGSHIESNSPGSLASIRKLSKHGPISSLSDSALSGANLTKTEKKLFLNPQSLDPQGNVTQVYDFIKEMRKKINQYKEDYNESNLSKSLAELKMGLDELPAKKNIMEIHTNFYVNLLWLYKDVKLALLETKRQGKQICRDEFRELANFDLSTIGKFPKNSVILRQQDELKKALGIEIKTPRSSEAIKSPPILNAPEQLNTSTEEAPIPLKPVETPKTPTKTTIPLLDENDEDVQRLNEILRQRAQKNVNKPTFAENVEKTKSENVKSAEKIKPESAKTHKVKFTDRIKNSSSYVSRFIPFGALAGALGVIKVVYDHIKTK